MTQEEFYQLVVKVIDSLPDEFFNKLNNVDIVVETWPTASQLASVHIKPLQTLLGLYQGTPPTKRRDSFYYPDKITVFSGPILQYSASKEETEATITRVVMHEIAHHFGMNETEINQRGY